MIKKKYYQLDDKSFNKYLTDLKNDSSTLHFLKDMDTSYFLVYDSDNQNLLLKLLQAQLQLDYLYQSLTLFQINLIKQTCLLDEIQSTLIMLIQNVFTYWTYVKINVSKQLRQL